MTKIYHTDVREAVLIDGEPDYPERIGRDGFIVEEGVVTGDLEARVRSHSHEHVGTARRAWWLGAQSVCRETQHQGKDAQYQE
jgi:hypothetical protein